MHIKYERGIGNRAAPADVKFYSAKDPSFYRFEAGAGLRYFAERHQYAARPGQGLFH